MIPKKKTIKKLSKKENPKVPVIMYHSVGHPNKNWIWSFLTCPVDVFEKQIKSLFKKGFNTIGLQELYNYMKYGESLPPKPIVLTFDDGYLDNWVYAYPILKKYGFTGTIYVNPEFVDPTIEYRPNLEDVWLGKVSKNALIDKGFLSWEEMRKMEEDGIMDMQSHALTHTLYFNSDKIIDFRHPGDKYIWIDWNEYPEKKYNYINENSPKKYGMPVYSYGEALVVRRYFPDQELEQTLNNYVKMNGEEDFFNRPNWKEELFKLVDEYKKTHDIFDRFESKEEYEERVKNELMLSKKIVEKKFKKQVKFLCWPDGACNETTLRLSSEVGYISSTFTSKDRGGKNVFGENPVRIKRMSVPIISNKDYSKIIYLRGFPFLLFIYTFMEIKKYCFLIKSLKFLRNFIYQIKR